MPPTPFPQRVHCRLDGSLHQAAGHVPTLAAAVHQQQMRWSSYHAGTTRAAAAALFAALAEAAEDVRVRRRTISPLACAAAAVFGPRTPEQAHALIRLPYQVARRVYAEAALTFGVFAIGEPQSDRHGRTLAAPPVTFIAIRPAFPTLDVHLAGDTGVMPAATDSGRDVLYPILGHTSSAATALAGYPRLLARYAVVDTAARGRS